MAELETKYSRFQRDTGIDLPAEIASGGNGGLDNYYNKTESDSITDALDVRIVELENGSGGGGVTDHGALTGLSDDDHTQYLNNTRGDVRYYTKTQIDTSLAGKSDTSHIHDGRYYTESEIDTLLSGKQDSGSYASSTHDHNSVYYTETEVNSLLDAKQDVGDYAAENHNHNDLYYTETEVDTLLAGKQAAGSYAAATHDHDNRYYTETEIDTALAGKSDTTHNHDSSYYTKAQVDTSLAGKSDTSHTHDERYFTETESNDVFVKWVDVVTGSESRPTGSKVFWIGGTEQPTNMAIGDVWLSETA